MKYLTLILAILPHIGFAQARFVSLPVHAPAWTNMVVLSLKTNEAAELVYISSTGFNLDCVVGDVTAGVGLGSIIAGPADFLVRTYSNDEQGIATFKLIPESFSPDKTVIIPEGTGGASINLEWSTNLLTWSTATNGFYTGTNGAKFFRIHADRIP